MARPRLAYIFYCMEKRAALKAEQPQRSHRQITRELGKRWRAEQQRATWQAQAAQDKQRYADAVALAPYGTIGWQGYRPNRPAAIDIAVDHAWRKQRGHAYWTVVTEHGALLIDKLCAERSPCNHDNNFRLDTPTIVRVLQANPVQGAQPGLWEHFSFIN